MEGDCCATISILYATPVSSVQITEAKYTRQDMVTTLSGNIEAWIGISAAHVYLFFENIYNALAEVRLISPSSTLATTTTGGPSSRTGLCGFCGLGLSLISILTILKVKISQLFTYLSHQLARLFWLKTNKTSKETSNGFG